MLILYEDTYYSLCTLSTLEINDVHNFHHELYKTFNLSKHNDAL